MTEVLFWLAVLSLVAGFGMAAAFIVGGRADRPRWDDFTGDQWP